jgi:DNA polymerase-1
MQTNYIKYSPEGKLLLPNIKKIFIPDEGYEIADADLSGADIQVVAADSECKWLLDYFSGPNKKKVYAHIASEFFQRDISDKSSEYKTYKGIFHGLNYMMGIRKLALLAGISEKLAEQLMEFYFHLNPEIRIWHSRLEHDVKNIGYVRNRFGRRMEFWFRKDNPTVMNEVCSAIPQSTIGDVINRAWVRIVKELPYIDVLMQTHDSLTMQYPIERAAEAHSAILDKMLIGIPYNPVLYIDSDIKVSRISYGDCEKIIH